MNGDNPLGVAGIGFDFFAKGFDAAIDAAFGDGEVADPNGTGLRRISLIVRDGKPVSYTHLTLPTIYSV